MGLISTPLTLVRAPVRLTLRAWEFGLSSAAEAARIGTALLDPDRGAPPPDFARRSPHLEADLGAPPEPGLGANGGPPDVAGPELRVDPPWAGYDQMTAADVRDRLAAAGPAEAAAVELYEATHRARRSVLDAAERALRN